MRRRRQDWRRQELAGFEAPVCVVSPHLDDGVLSCGYVLAARPGATVLTVFAGAPDGPAGPWDAELTGSRTARDANEVRRREDADATAALGATPRWLDLHEAQYATASDAVRSTAVMDAVAAALADIAPATVLAPLGIGHPDHELVGRVCRTLVAPANQWYLYEDVPYAPSRTALRRLRRRLAGFADAREDVLARVAEVVVLGPPVDVLGDAGRKMAATGCYRTQVEGLRRSNPRFEARVRAPERYREAAPRPA